mmetsp:Transcript_2549/g.5939  ORF Transcript_2549/g.5939 Transcript_2549/m.5939 type:complete len:244 (+) Transcript_2549:1014-1745(+)
MEAEEVAGSAAADKLCEYHAPFAAEQFARRAQAVQREQVVPGGARDAFSLQDQEGGAGQQELPFSVPHREDPVPATDQDAVEKVPREAHTALPCAHHAVGAHHAGAAKLLPHRARHTTELAHPPEPLEAVRKTGGTGLRGGGKGAAERAADVRPDRTPGLVRKGRKTLSGENRAHDAVRAVVERSRLVPERVWDAGRGAGRVPHLRTYRAPLHPDAARRQAESGLQKQYGVYPRVHYVLAASV